jgi:glutamine amidotransferase
MNYLKERGLDLLLKGLRQPVLGICLGMQLMCRYSEENDTECLGIFEEEVKKFNPVPAAGKESPGMDGAKFDGAKPGGAKLLTLKVPQIGWNTIYNLRSDLFNGIGDNSYCYFVHGYYAALGGHTIATTDYVQPYSSALHNKNFYGVQFHPEKSAAVGERILRNFLDL